MTAVTKTIGKKGFCPGCRHLRDLKLAPGSKSPLHPGFSWSDRTNFVLADHEDPTMGGPCTGADQTPIMLESAND